MRRPPDAKRRAEEEAFRAEVLRMEQEKRKARFCALLMACCNISGGCQP